MKKTLVNSSISLSEPQLHRSISRKHKKFYLEVKNLSYWGYSIDAAYRSAGKN